MTFTKNCVQAVNDWQRGGDHRQKVKRGYELKKEALSLPMKFRTCDALCFRQEAHTKDRVWQLIANNNLPETIAAWTTDLAIAKHFKGGVPPHDLRGVIFSLQPPEGSVIVNLAALYDEPCFLAAVERFKPEIKGFSDGIGKYHNTQKEVVLELGHLHSSTILHFGGYSSSRDRLRISGQIPTPEDLAEFDRLCTRAGVALGPWWLCETGTKNVLDRINALRQL